MVYSDPSPFDMTIPENSLDITGQIRYVSTNFTPMFYMILAINCPKQRGSEDQGVGRAAVTKFPSYFLFFDCILEAGTRVRAM